MRTRDDFNCKSSTEMKLDFLLLNLLFAKDYWNQISSIQPYPVTKQNTIVNNC